MTSDDISPLQKETPRQFLERLRDGLLQEREMNSYLTRAFEHIQKHPDQFKANTIYDPEYCKVHSSYAQGWIMAITGNEQRAHGAIELPSVLEYVEALVELYYRVHPQEAAP